MNQPLDIRTLITDQYCRSERDVRAYLDGIAADLPGKLRALQKHQFSVGFVKDPLENIFRCRIVSASRYQHFLIQYNPERSKRHAGAGRLRPPPEFASVNGGCFLCRSNIIWQQSGLEIGCAINLNGRDYTAWTSPFPLKPGHFIVATNAHTPQKWSAGDAGFTLDELLKDLLSLAAQLPGYVVFYNGENAGATIPHHRHFQAFERDGCEQFPLEQAAAASSSTACRAGTVVDNYPLTALYVRGASTETGTLAEKAREWANAWTETCGDMATMNVISSLEIRSDGTREMHVFLVPRHQHFPRASGISSAVGGLEVMGEIVLTTEEEKRRLDSGQITFDFVCGVLAGVDIAKQFAAFRQCTSLVSAGCGVDKF